jgi:2'-5' RNA ligase
VAKTVTIDELHLTLRIPDDTPEDAAEEIRRTLAGDDFTDRLRRAVLSALRAFPELNAVRVSLTR